MRRAFGFGDTTDTDPFLLLDDFRNERPEDYLAGFPWHPHRGIETITYVLAGTVDHADSMGNQGSIGAGDIQWMTAGRGIVHQEMPHGDGGGRMHGFQLWANLPSSQKMTAPRYQEITAAEIPTVTDDDGTQIKVVSGSYWGAKGPVEGIATDPVYLDVFVKPGATKRLPMDTRRNAFAYVFEGDGAFRDASEPIPIPTDVVGSSLQIDSDVRDRSLVLFSSGDEIAVTAGEQGLRFLLVSGKPLREPVAWHGPIVMNTQDELRTAFRQLNDGSFLDPVP